MIRLTKGEIPKWLELNKAVKTEEYKVAPSSKKPSPWRAEEVVAALKAECADKCMYCEGIIDDVSYSAVEHIKPKSRFEDLVIDWDNLGLACARCNTNKGEYWTEDVDLQLLNPYQDLLAEHISFRGPLTVAKLGSSRGANTVRKLKFSKREDLVISRMRRIEELSCRLALWHEAENDEMKSLFAEDVRESISETCEFSAVLRTYAAESGFPI